jgi:hypothetical protein
MSLFWWEGHDKQKKKLVANISTLEAVHWSGIIGQYARVTLVYTQKRWGWEGEPMSDLFPHNQYDANIINQPETEYRIAKYPFRIRHMYIDSATKKEKHWDSTHCPVCFWNYEVYGVWDSMIDKGTKFCRRCGQKIKWEGDEDE